MGKFFFRVCITFLCICKTTGSIAQVNLNDSLALVDFYNSTDGAHWYNNANWLTGPVNTWFGIYIENNRVAQFYFNYDNNIHGTLPSSLGNLSELYTFLIEGNNKLTATIPSSFLNLVKLVTFDISYCQISGSIPAFNNNFPALKSVVLKNNQLTGTIPLSLGEVPNLATIQFENNQLTGNIPANFTNLTQLQILSVSNNHLTGQIPSLTNTTHITDLLLNNNQFSGPFPDFHTSNIFSELDFDHNQFSGEVPAWLATKSMDILTLNNNQLTHIPASFSNFNQYTEVSMQNNHLNFDSLEYIIANSEHYSFYYNPQLNIPVTFSPQGMYGQLSVHAGGTLSKNTYQWYRNNNLYKVNVGDSILIIDTPGVYFVKVNNTVVTTLQLVSDSIAITECTASKPTITANKSLSNICPRDSVILTSSDAVSYVWNTGATTKSISIKSSGNYTVSIIDVNGCKNTSDTTKATYRPCLKPTALSVANIKATTAKVSWAAVPCAVGYQYEWKKKGIAPWTAAQTTAINKTITGLLANTTYQWRVITACKISPDTITSAGYANGAEFKTLATTVVSVNGNGQVDLKLNSKSLSALVYPNPANKTATVNISDATGLVQVILTDPTGKEIWTSNKITNRNISIDVSKLSPGTYLIVVKDQVSNKTLKLAKE